MVKHPDSQDLSGIEKAICAFAVFVTRCWVAGWVIVQKYDRGGIVSDSTAPVLTLGHGGF